MTVFTPRPHQLPMWQHVYRSACCLLFASLGSGKTGTVLDALNYMLATGKLTKTDRILVVAPLRVANISWPEETEKFTWQHLTMAVATGTPAHRLKALRSDANIVVINFDNVQWLINQPESEWFTVLVVDECSRLGAYRGYNGAAKQARALAKLRRRNNIKRFIGLTATPGALIKQWGMLYFCDKGKALGQTFNVFVERYFDTVQVGRDAYAVKHVPKPGSFAKITKKMKQFALTVDANEIFGVDQPVHLDYWIELPPATRTKYTQMEQEAIIEFDNGDTAEAANSGAALQKCLQLANGAVYLTDENGDASDAWQMVHDEKLAQLRDIVEKTDGANLIVVYQFKHDLARLQKAFPQGVLLDDHVKKKWDNGKVSLMFLHAASAGHGLSLQGTGKPTSGGHHMIFFGCAFGHELFEQVCGRINPMRQKQSGYTNRTVFYHHIRARGTVDEAVKESIDKGITDQQALLNYFKGKKQ